MLVKNDNKKCDNEIFSHILNVSDSRLFSGNIFSFAVNSRYCKTIATEMKLNFTKVLFFRFSEFKQLYKM